MKEAKLCGFVEFYGAWKQLDKLDYPSPLGYFGRGSGSFASLMA